MNSATYKYKRKIVTVIAAFMLGFTALVGIQGCSSGGGGSDPVIVVPQDSDPVGYFTGTATLDTATNPVSDMVGMAYGSRLMVFSMTENVLFDITMDITLTDFTGTVDVYIAGEIDLTNTVTITGTTNNSQIEGTFAGGSGLSSGSFDILFDITNNIGATLARADGNVFFGALSGIDIGSDGFAFLNISATYDIGDTTTEICEAFGNLVIPDSEVNIYQLLHDVVDIGGGSCAAPHLSTGHTGFASIIATSSDKDTFAFAYANDSVALFSDGLIRN